MNIINYPQSAKAFVFFGLWTLILRWYDDTGRTAAFRETIMKIRKATAEEMLALWGYPDIQTASPTARFFSHHISSGNALFWALDNDGEIIGELYVFLDLEDKDFADGQNTAYLCAFRIEKEYRGRGLGTRLMETVLADLKAAGFQRAAIGVGPDEERNVRLYHRMGFTEKIKDCHVDPCAMDADMNPAPDDCFWLLAKDL